MSNTSVEASKSLWMADFQIPPRGPLAGSAEADVVVVGSGIAGLSCAYELSRDGLSVIVVDRGAIGGGMTARTTAHLASQIDDYYHALIKVRGVAEARSYYESQSMAITRMETIAREEEIDCDFMRLDGYLILAPGSDPRMLERERDACRRVGFDEVEWADPPAMTMPGPALRFPGQARVHPLKYLAGLARAIEARGGRIFADTPIVDVEEKNGRVRVATKRWARGARGLRHRRHEFADQRPLRDPQQAGAVSHVRHRREHSRGGRARRALLGHARSLSLRAHPARRWRARVAHRRRRGSQERGGGRFQRALRPARGVDAAVFPGHGRGRLSLVGAGDGARGRSAVHRPQPRQPAHLRRHRRFRRGHDQRRRGGHAALLACPARRTRMGAPLSPAARLAARRAPIFQRERDGR